VVNNCTLTSCPDMAMWNGTYIEDDNATLEVDASLFENAKNAVVSVDGGEFEITSSFFNENYIGLMVLPYANGHSGYVENTRFTTSALIAPYYNEVGFAGIQCIGVAYIVIGDSSNSSYNQFDNILYGIHSKDSYIRVVDNHFTNMEYQQSYSYTGPFPTKPTGIFSTTAQSGAKVYIGGDNSGGYYKSNYFENCEFGVYTLDNDFVAIAGNEFYWTSQNNGFHPAISVYNYTKSQVPVKIVGNFIDAYRKGIHGVNFLEGIIECNTINDLQNPSSAAPNEYSFGILTQGCSNSYSYNTVMGNTNSDNRVMGISVNVDDAPALHCNDIDEVGIALMASGYNGYCDFRTDYLNDCNVGLYLHHSTGFIGPQGGSNDPCDINFIGTFQSWDTYTFNANGANSPLYVRTSPTYPYQPSNNGTNNIAFTINTTSGTGLTCDANYCSDQLSQYYSANPGNGAGGYITTGNLLYGLSPSLLSKYLNVIQDSVNYTSFVPEMRWLGKYHVLDKLLQNNIGLNQVYSGFINTCASNSIGKTVQVHALIDAKSYTMASLINNNINRTNKIDSSYCLYNGLFLKGIAGKDGIEFDNTDIASLVDLAWKCPFEYGTAVYSARLTLGEMGDTTWYFNQCETASASNGLKGVRYPSGVQEAVTTTRVYPNPAQTDITLETIVPVGQNAEFYLLNCLGEKVISLQITEGVHTIPIRVKGLSSGLYLWGVKCTDGKFESGKLIVNK